jgi:four helix bundle protein
MFPYEKLIAYNKAFANQRRVMAVLQQYENIPAYVKNQFGRASLSIMLNIAEGSGRTSIKERKYFFTIARGSVFECSALLDLLFAQQEITQSIHTELKTEYEEISRILYTMIRNLSSQS